jgi:hypothetical protein
MGQVPPNKEKLDSDRYPVVRFWTFKANPEGVGRTGAEPSCGA